MEHAMNDIGHKICIHIHNQLVKDTYLMISSAFFKPGRRNIVLVGLVNLGVKPDFSNHTLNGIEDFVYWNMQ